jgi:hypothetical protein
MTIDISSLPIHFEKDTAYIRMKALTWIANYGSLTEMIQSSSGKLLSEIIQHDMLEGKSLIVNFFGIVSIDDHSLEDVAHATEKTGRKLIVINASQVQKELTAYIQVKPNITLNNGTIIFNSSNPKEAQTAAENVSRIEHDIVIDIVKRSYEEFPAKKMQRLQSTPLYASGVFNARRIVSRRSDFMWICLIMSERLANIMDEFKPKASRLLAVSLRSSPFAGALGILGSIDIEIVDHMGPDLKILEEYTLGTNQEDINYIYIGDWIIGGTEVKIAETYAVARHCTVEHVLVIGSLFAPEDYEVKHTSLSKAPKAHSLVKLNDALPEARYDIWRTDA